MAHSSHPNPNTKAVYKVVLFTILSFGLYRIYWSYKMWKQISMVQNRQISAGLRTLLLFVPFVNIYVIYKQYKNLDSILQNGKTKDGFDPLVATILALFLSIVTDAIYQHKMNQYWIAEKGGTVPKGINIKEVLFILVFGYLWFAYINLLVSIATTEPGSDPETQKKQEELEGFIDDLQNGDVETPALNNYFSEDDFSVRIPGNLELDEAESVDETRVYRYTEGVTQDKLYQIAVTDIAAEGEIVPVEEEERIKGLVIDALGDTYESISTTQTRTVSTAQASEIEAENNGFHIKTAVLIHKGKVYEITYIAPDKNDVTEKYDTMIETFELL